MSGCSPSSFSYFWGICSFHHIICTIEKYILQWKMETEKIWALGVAHGHALNAAAVPGLPKPSDDSTHKEVSPFWTKEGRREMQWVFTITLQILVSLLPSREALTWAGEVWLWLELPTPGHFACNDYCCSLFIALALLSEAPVQCCWGKGQYGIDGQSQQREEWKMVNLYAQISELEPSNFFLFLCPIHTSLDFIMTSR